MRLRRWETLLSDCQDLYFVGLVDGRESYLRNTLCFMVEDKLGQQYEVLLEDRPYLVVDEEDLTKYWSISEGKRGSTFIVEDSPFPAQFPGVLEPDEVVHYVVATWDVCLEVLSTREPLVRRRPSRTERRKDSDKTTLKRDAGSES